jgi:DNA-binding winged helix-turn-helix (wHTH) protein/Tol biopolymer transport system component
MPSGYRFDDIEIDVQNFRLLKAGQAVAVEPKALYLLIFLVENRGRLLARREIIDSVWRETFVTDHVLSSTIGQLRKGLGDDAKLPRYIETVPTLGYRFIAQIEGQGERETVSEISAAAPFAEVVATDDGKSEESPVHPQVGSCGVETPPMLFLRRRLHLPRPLIFAIVASGLGILAAALLFRHIPGKHEALRHGAPQTAVEQRITFNPPDAPVGAASISPDGKYIAYSDFTGLYIRVIASGETRLWGVPRNFVATPNAWFPDGIHLLVTRLEQPSQKPSLWKLSLLGGTPRLLMENAAGGAVSPDGSRIAYLPGSKLHTATPDLLVDVHDVGSDIWVMDSEGTNPRRIVAMQKGADAIPSNRISSVIWSPGGKRIAYIERHGLASSDPTVDSFSLRTRDSTGGDVHVLLDDARLEPNLSWVADGRVLYTYSEDPGGERGDQGIRSIQVDERTGEATGQPLSVTRGQGRIGGLSATVDGRRLVLWRKNTEPQAFISEFESGSHRLKLPRRFTLDANGNLAEAWTPDSKAVLFVSNRNGTWKLFKQAVDETTAEVLVEGRNLFLPRLSADGSQILYLAYSNPRDSSYLVPLMRVPLAGGPPQLVLQASSITNHQCASLPSHVCILSSQTGPDATFLTFDTEHGIGRVVTKTDHFTNWSLSRDGSKLAIFLSEHQVRFFNLNTGAAHDVSVDDWNLNNGDWSADGKSVFLPSYTTAGQPVILDVNEAGKTVVVLQGAPNTSFQWLVSSPDGHSAIVEEDVPGDNNVWMIENF